MTIAEVHVVDPGDDVLLTVNGEVDLTNRDAVADDINAAISNRTTSVTVDLTELTYLDSAGLRLFFTLADRLVLIQVHLVLVVPEAALSRRVIALSGLDQVVEVRPGRGA